MQKKRLLHIVGGVFLCERIYNEKGISTIYRDNQNNGKAINSKYLHFVFSFIVWERDNSKISLFLYWVIPYGKGRFSNYRHFHIDKMMAARMKWNQKSCVDRQRVQAKLYSYR